MKILRLIDILVLNFAAVAFAVEQSVWVRTEGFAKRYFAFAFAQLLVSAIGVLDTRNKTTNQNPPGRVTRGKSALAPPCWISCLALLCYVVALGHIAAHLLARYAKGSEVAWGRTKGKLKKLWRIGTSRWRERSFAPNIHQSRHPRLLW
jgi:hypothetical protein